MTLIDIAEDLCAQLEPMRFAPPVAHVYNPLTYARPAYAQYAARYGCGKKQAVLLGMNPGPWGMVQTGVPFGEVAAVTQWLGIDAPIERPTREHPNRRIEGYACRRSEVSGARLWGWAKETFGTAESFFQRFFVLNYCPLAFMEEGGRNLTPDKLPKSERVPLLDACDEALRQAIRCLEPQWIIGIGNFAEQRARIALHGHDVSISRIIHPSPASPLANRGWGEHVNRRLVELGLLEPKR